MSFALGPNDTTNPGPSGNAQLQPGMTTSELLAFLGQRRFGQANRQDGSGGVGGLALLGLLAQQSQSGPNLPALPQIPPLTKAPSRLSTRQIAGAARSLRVAASKRKGRASTILGGSIGADPERKTLLGA